MVASHAILISADVKHELASDDDRISSDLSGAQISQVYEVSEFEPDLLKGHDLYIKLITHVGVGKHVNLEDGDTADVVDT